MNYLENNIKLIREMKGDNMENSFKHISGLKKTILDINKRANAIPESKRVYNLKTGNNLIRFDNLNSSKPIRVTEREKYLLQLLIISKCIRRIDYYEISPELRKRYADNNDFRAYIYEILDIENSRFDRLRAIKKDRPLNYSALCLMTDVKTGNEAFKRFTVNKGFYYFRPDSLEVIANYVWKYHTVTLTDLANFYLDHITIRPSVYGKIEVLTRDDQLTYIIDMLKALNELGWWKQYDLTIKKNANVRRNKLNVHGNTLVFIEEKRTIKKAV
ncbi:hypothetical protein PO181_00220 [Leuconostoc suionicum]|uniref:hypothetical protein n=1 Tax=Leuconostoc suionicum TaxID=1511761 RepID=UPI00233E5B0D|nr:hypothetical protein [Leuconostoc suionicum]MDC2815429.1 hypothetical protein [Leuconostoc suionicum]